MDILVSWGELNPSKWRMAKLTSLVSCVSVE